MKMCGNLYVNKTYTDGHISRHLGLLAEKVLKLSLDGYDASKWL